MQKHSRIFATFLLLAITVGCLRVCPPPQTLVSLDWNAGHCRADRVLAGFRVGSTGLDFEIRRASRNLHVCVVIEESSQKAESREENYHVVSSIGERFVPRAQQTKDANGK
jgi:hypothetical protein